MSTMQLKRLRHHHISPNKNISRQIFVQPRNKPAKESAAGYSSIYTKRTTLPLTDKLISPSITSNVSPTNKSAHKKSQA